MGNSDCAGVVMEADGQAGRRSILKNRTGNRIWAIRGLKVLSLLAAVLAVLSIAWKTLYIHRNYDEDRIIGFYREPEDSLDVVLIGASDISRAYCSGLAYEDYGITSYPFTINGDAVQVWRAQLDETMRLQNPDVVVIEVNGALYSASEEEQYHMYQTAVERMALHLPLFSETRLHMIRTYLKETGRYGEALGLLVPLYAYHSNQPGGIRSAAATIRDNLHFGADNNGVLTLRGFETLTRKVSTGKLIPDYEESDATQELDPAYEKALRSFLSYCTKKYPKTNILFVRTPHLFEENNARMQMIFGRTNRIGQIIEEYGFPFLNFEKKKAEVGIDNQTDFYDSNHLNVSGMRKFTKWFSEYLLEHGVEPRALSGVEKEQWEHTARYTKLLLDYYEKLQGEGSNGKDLFESTETLEILRQMEESGGFEAEAASMQKEEAAG